MLIVAGTIEIDPAGRAALEAAFDRMREASLAEAGCLDYQAYADRSHEGAYFIFETWRTQDDLTAHFQTPHMAEFGAALGSVAVRSMQVKKYEISSVGDVP